MNFLAHSYLSFQDADIITGNMISDFIKGKKQYEYPAQIFKGILLHRRIDSFTDTHEATKQAAAILKPAANRYAGAFVDVVYDHFLANDATHFVHEQNLQDHAAVVYAALSKNINWLPDHFAPMLPFMKEQNWLYNYRLKSGIEKSFVGIARRAKYIEDTKLVYALFLSEYNALQACYYKFFPDLFQYVQEQYEDIYSS